MTFGIGSCVLNKVYPPMTNITVAAGVYGIVEGCIIISVHFLRKDHADITYGLVLPPTHHGPRYLDVPYGDVHFPLNIPPVLATLSDTKILDIVEGHVVLQISSQARSLPDADKWVVAEHEEMSSIERNKVIGWT